VHGGWATSPAARRHSAQTRYHPPARARAPRHARGAASEQPPRGGHGHTSLRIAVATMSVSRTAGASITSSPASSASELARKTCGSEPCVDRQQPQIAKRKALENGAPRVRCASVEKGAAGPAAAGTLLAGGQPRGSRPATARQPARPPTTRPGICARRAQPPCRVACRARWMGRDMEFSRLPWCPSSAESCALSLVRNGNALPCERRWSRSAGCTDASNISSSHRSSRKWMKTCPISTG